ncbi:MAG: TolC family protein [Bacteroides sp.]|nr:TolC family protein [Bacteroides sp.]
MKRYLFLLGILLFALPSRSQDTLPLSLAEVEALFIRNNLQLIAGRFQIDIAEAEMMQARLWENPTLTLSDLNLWSSRSQRDGETIPPLFGSFARNTEFSVELSQLIRTAGKRRKLVRREQVSGQMVAEEFEELLRNLKTELREQVISLSYLQDYLEVLLAQSASLSRLLESHRKQVASGNLSRSELIRLQAAALELENELYETRTEYNEQQRTLRALLCCDAFTHIRILSEGEQQMVGPRQLSVHELVEKAILHRPDLRTARLQTDYHRRTLSYEKALRMPDLTVGASYDRWGGVWKNFIGLGVSVDLPLFNRNQGAIRAARLSIDQNHYLVQQQENEIAHDVVAAYNNYGIAYEFYQTLSQEGLREELDAMYEVYSRNLTERHISMMEFIDFMEAYRTNRQTLLTARKNLSIQWETLQYTIGKDL